MDLIIYYFDNESGLFVGGEGVERASQTVLLDSDVDGRPIVRALENAVLDKVSDAVEFVRLISRSDAIKKSRASLSGRPTSCL